MSTKVVLPKTSSLDPNEKKDAEKRLQQMMKEVEFKQKQLLKLVDKKESDSAKNKLKK
jgi:tetrahydromethanopterin S-methyltransferase subunit G